MPKHVYFQTSTCKRKMLFSAMRNSNFSSIENCVLLEIVIVLKAYCKKISNFRKLIKDINRKLPFKIIQFEYCL